MTDGTNTAHTPLSAGHWNAKTPLMDRLEALMKRLKLNDGPFMTIPADPERDGDLIVHDAQAAITTLLSHVEVLRKALEWAMAEIDRVSNSKCGFAYPQGIVHQYPHSETEQRVTSTKYHEAITALDQTKATP